MQFYAQTNLQLFNQLQREGYSMEDRISIGKTYQLAMKLFTGRYRPSGKTFIAHVIGTASILASLHVSAKIIAAGLIHSIYAEGDFGSIKKGVSLTKRKQVISIVGQEVEDYVYRYAGLAWNVQNISTICDRIDQLTPIDRDIILIRLADQLEDNLDLGIMYCSNHRNRQIFFKNMGSIMVEIANKIGFPTLATELEIAFKATLLATIPREFCQQYQESYSFLISPKSYRRKLLGAVFQKFARGRNQLHSIRGQIKSRLRSWYFLKKLTD
jgi:(p)ppGpp synthase/HD superfamily hydrolase